MKKRFWLGLGAFAACSLAQGGAFAQAPVTNFDQGSLSADARPFSYEKAKERFDGDAARQPTPEQLVGEWKIVAIAYSDMPGFYRPEGVDYLIGGKGKLTISAEAYPFEEPSQVLSFQDEVHDEFGYSRGPASVKLEDASAVMQSRGGLNASILPRYESRMVADADMLCKYQGWSSTGSGGVDTHFEGFAKVR